MDDDTLYIDKDVHELLTQVDRWCRKHDQHCPAFSDFFEMSPILLFEGCPGYPEKIYEKKFRRDWDQACALMIEHRALENSGWPGHNSSLLIVERLRKLLGRVKPRPGCPEHLLPKNPDKPTLLDVLRVTRFHLAQRYPRADHIKHWTRVFNEDGMKWYCPELLKNPEGDRPWLEALRTMSEQGVLTTGYDPASGRMLDTLWFEKLAALITKLEILESTLAAQETPTDNSTPPTAETPNSPFEIPVMSEVAGLGVLDRLFGITLLLRLIRSVNGKDAVNGDFTDIVHGGFERLGYMPEFEKAHAGRWLTADVWAGMVQYLRAEGAVVKHNVQPEPWCLVRVAVLVELQKKLIDLLRPCIYVGLSPSGSFVTRVTHLESGGPHTLALSVTAADENHDDGAEVRLALDGMEVGKLATTWVAEGPDGAPAKPLESHDKLFWMKRALEFAERFPRYTWRDLKGGFPKSDRVIDVLGGVAFLGAAGDASSEKAWEDAYDAMVAAEAVMTQITLGEPDSKVFFFSPLALKKLITKHEEPPVKVGGICGDALPAVGAGLYGDIGDVGSAVNSTSQGMPPLSVIGCAPEKLYVQQVPIASPAHYDFDGGDVCINADEGPKALRKAIEEEVDELRARLQDVFNRSISSGPMPWRAALCIVETTLSEYSENEEVLSKAGDFFAEISRIEKNPIRYASWLACSELLSRLRAMTKGLKPKVDSCTVEEHRSALKDLAGEVKS